MSYDLIFQKANELYLQGALNQAEQLYRQILETMPENPDVLNMLGLLAQAKGLHNEAADCFYKALKSASNHLPLYFNLAVSLTSAGHLKEAAAAYEHVLTLNPQLKEAHNNLGGIYEKCGDNSQAAAEYRKALDIDSQYLEAAVNLAALEKDKTKLQTLAKKHPETSLPLYYLAYLENQDCNYKEAKHYIEEVLNKTDATDEVFLLAGEIFLKTNNLPAATEAFSRALNLNPKSIPALINLGVFNDDEEMLRKALNLAPDNAEAHANYANLLYKQKRTLEALEEYRKAVILRPDMPELSNNLGLILKDNGDYAQALDLFLDAYLKAPEKTDFSVNLAETLVLLHQKNPEQALDIAQNWHKVAPENPFATHTLNAFSGKISEKIDTDYARALFDVFAQNYDKTMQNINYAVIDKIKELNIPFQGKILDLGCGTGLAGKTFKNNKNIFIGVDISQKMLNIATQTQAYEKLICQDINKYLTDASKDYSLIMALDVFNYIADFKPLLQKGFPVPLLFTIENAPAQVKTYTLAPNGRYQHNQEYIATMLMSIGYQNISQYPLELRKENDKTVSGTLFFTQK